MSPPFCGTDMGKLALVLEAIKKDQEKKNKKIAMLTHRTVSRRSQPADHRRPASVSPNISATTVSMKDFKLIAVLGKGAFGKVGHGSLSCLAYFKVFLAEKVSSQKTVAIKMIKKTVIVESDDFEITMLERDVLKLGWDCR